MLDELGRQRVARRAIKIIPHGPLAVGHQKFAERAALQRGCRAAEQGLGAARDGRDPAVAVEHEGAVRRGVEHRLELVDFVLGGAEREYAGAPALFGFGAGEDERMRRAAAPRHGKQTAFDRYAVVGRDERHQRRLAALGERAYARQRKQRGEAAGRRQGVEAFVSAPFQEMPVGIEQHVVAVDQNAERQALEQQRFE